MAGPRSFPAEAFFHENTHTYQSHPVMNIIHTHLETLLRAAAAMQLGVALLNLALVRIMKWKPDLDRLPLLVREVFYIHSLFISITLAIFAVLTWRFTGDIASA